MADLEAVLADVSYLMAMEKIRNEPYKRSTKKVQLPDPRYRQLFISVTVIYQGYIWKTETAQAKKINILQAKQIKILYAKHFSFQLPWCDVQVSARKNSD